MPLNTLEKLIQGDSKVLETYKFIKEKWDEILLDFDWDSENAVESMGQLVTNWQSTMERIAGDKWLGREIMVIVGIGKFYYSEIGFDAHEKEVQIIYNGFLNSKCSVEVKMLTEKVGKLYRINIS